MQVEETCKIAYAFLYDKEKKERLKESKCIKCYYRKGRLGGAAMTTCNCQICDKEMLFGSTATDKLCLDCGLKNKICVECGSDVNLKNRKK